MRLNLEISKSAVLQHTCMNIEATRKNITNDLRMIFRSVFVHANRLCQWNARNVASRRVFGSFWIRA